jgi:hypothetical protein
MCIQGLFFPEETDISPYVGRGEWITLFGSGLKNMVNKAL